MNQIPVAARLSESDQTSPGCHTASYTMDARSFLGVNWLGHGADHPPPTDTEVKETAELYLYSPCVFMEYYRVNFNFIIHEYMGTAIAQWLRCGATNQKVAGSIPAGVIGIFN